MGLSWTFLDNSITYVDWLFRIFKKFVGNHASESKSQFVFLHQYRKHD